METLGVVVRGRDSDHDPRVGQVAEHGLVKHLVAHPAAKDFDEISASACLVRCSEFLLETLFRNPGSGPIDHLFAA